MSLNEDSKPLLRENSRSPTPSYGSPSESGSESSDRVLARRLIQTSDSAMEEQSNSLTVEEARSLQEKSIELRDHHAISNTETFLHFLKSNFGTGIFGLSESIKQSGLVFGPVVLVVIAVMAVSCMYLLVKCSRILCRRNRMTALDYGDAAYTAALPFSRRWAKLFRQAVNSFLLITQFGFCCVYVLFIADNIVQILEACGVNIDSEDDNSSRIFSAVILIPLVVLSFIRNLDLLAPLSGIANLSTAFGLITIMYYCFAHLNLPKEGGFAGPIDELPIIAPPLQWPLFFGTVLYSFESIGVVLPLENKMKKPKDFNKVLISSMTVVTIFYVIVSVSGYICFGENIKGSLPLNLPRKGNSNWIYSVVKLYLIFAILTSYALQFYVPIDILERFIIGKMKNRLYNRRIITMMPYILRIFGVAGTVGLAAAIPRIDLFISLIGAASSSCLALIFPPVIYILTYHNQGAHAVRCTKVLCAIVAIIGVVGFGFGTYASLAQIVKYFSDKHQQSAA